MIFICLLGWSVVSITNVSVFVSVKLINAVSFLLRVILTGRTVSLAVIFIKASVQLTSASFNFTDFGFSSE